MVDLILAILSVGLLAAGAVGIGSATRPASVGTFRWTPSSAPAPTVPGPVDSPAPSPRARANAAPSTPGASGSPAGASGRVTADPAEPARPGRPVKFEILRLQLVMPVRPVGVRPDGQMQLPDRPQELGWYRFGPRPGAPMGSAVLAGHVDSLRYGVGPLVGLRSVHRGDRLAVITGTGRERFRVVAAGLIDKSRFPSARLFDRTGQPRLWVITCAGTYDPAHGGYQANLVVEAVPV